MALLGICLFLTGALGDETFDKLIQSGKYKEAIDYADQKIPAAKRDADVWVKIAKANEKIGLTEKALACYMVSWRMNPKHYGSLVGAARIYNKLDQPENAMNMAQKALDQNFTGEASWEYARAAIALDKPAEAKKALEKVIETDPDNVVANRELGLIYFDDKQYRQAAPLLIKSYENKADPNVAYKIGKAYLESGNDNAAVEYLKKTIEQKSSFYQAGLDLARAYYGMGKYLAAAAEYERIESKVSFVASDYYNQAIAFEQTGKEGKAAEAYRQAVAKSGGSKEKKVILARVKVGKFDLEQKKYNSALKHFEFIADADPKARMVPEIYFLLADAHIGAKNTGQAISALEKAIDLDKSNVEAYARLADLYEKSGQAAKAKQTYETMMSLSPNDPTVYLVLGKYNLNAKKYSEALDMFVKSNSLEKSVEALEGIAISAANLNQWDKARDAAESVIGLDQGRTEARIVLYRAYMRDKNYREAKKHLERLVLKESGNLEYWKDLATAYQKTGENDKLAEADKKIIALDPKNAESRLRFAEYSLKKNDKATAYKLYKELAVLTPKNPDVFKRLFALAKEKDEKKEAVDYLRSYLALNPNDAEAQRDLGDLLYERKDFDGALAAYRQAIKLDPTIKGFYKRYAEIVIAKGQQNEVIKALNGVIRTGEADFGTYQTLGMMYAKKNMYDKSIEMYQKALQLQPQNVEALVALAEAQAASGDIGEAVITYEQVVMMNPESGEEYKALGQLYLKQDKKEQAIRAFEKYLSKVSRDDEVALQVGEYFHKRRKYQKAVQYLSKIQGAKKSDFEVELMLGESLFKAGEYKDAIGMLEELRKRNPKLSVMQDILKMLAEAYEKTENDSKAIDIYGAYVGLKGVSDPDAAYKYARLQEKSSSAAAQKIYEENVVKYSGDFRNFLRLGLIYSKSKTSLPKAAGMLKKAATLADTIPSVWLEIGKVYGQLNKEDEELAAYKKYLQSDPQNLEANIRVGTILLNKGKTTEGMVYLETANTLSPNNIKVIEPLAMGYVKTNRKEEALDLLNKAKSLKPRDAGIRRQLYKLYMAMGQKKKAVSEIKELLSIKRDNETLLLYANLLLEEGKLRDAEEAIENVRATEPENLDALMTLAAIQRARKKYDEAIETYKEAIYINGDYAPAIFERAEVYMIQDKVQWAQKFYERALRADPKFALAELGLAKIAKMRKSDDQYLKHVENAYELDPDNPLIKKEYRQARK
jgi:tetratricopeptide (TPR) repeat protein